MITDEVGVMLSYPVISTQGIEDADGMKIIKAGNQGVGEQTGGNGARFLQSGENRNGKAK